MRRGLDSLECPNPCGQRLPLIALIEQPAIARRILEHLGLDSEPIRPAPARAPPLPDELDWGA